MAQSDLAEWYKLETGFFHDHVRHTRYLEKEKNRYKRVKEDWRNCGGLDTGGFGAVHEQVRGTTGLHRVKTVDKRSLLPNFDYSRELLVMALLAEVCVLVPEGLYPGLLSVWNFLGTV